MFVRVLSVSVRVRPCAVRVSPRTSMFVRVRPCAVRRAVHFPLVKIKPLCLYSRNQRKI